MASKKQLKNNDLPDFGDFDDTFEDFNFGDEGGSNSRKPGSPIKRGVKEALRSHFTRPESYRAYVGKVLPRQYGELWDDYTTISGSVGEAVDSVRKQAQQPLNELAKNLQRNLSKKHTRVHGWLKNLENNTQEFKSDPKQAEKARAQATQLAMEQVFAGYQQQQQEDTKVREEVEGDRFARQYVKLQSQERLLGTMARALDHQVKFITGVELPYKRKSLELQYRMAHGITDLVEVARGLAEQQRKQLDVVVKNTALPDIQKQQLSEGYKQTIRNKFIDKSLGMFGGKGGAGELMAGFTKNITDSLKMAAEMALMGIDSANMASGDDFESSPDARKKNFAKSVAGFALDNVGPGAAGKLSRSAMRKFPNATRKIFKGARKLGYGKDNLHSIIQQYANGDTGGGDGWLRDLVGMALPGRDNDTKVNRASGKNLAEVTHFDHATRRSIVEVIPGFLARILQELQVTRTGDNAIKPMSFSFSKGKFETQSQASSDLKALIGKNSQKNNLKGLISQLEKSGSKFSDEDRQKLEQVLITSRRGGRTMTANALMNDKFFTTGSVKASDEQGKAYSQAFRKLFDGNKDGRFTDSNKGVRSRDKFFGQLAKTDNDEVNVRALIQELFDNGQGDLAYANGLVDAEGNINKQALYDGIAGIAPSAGEEPSAPKGRRAKRKQTRQMVYAGQPSTMQPIQTVQAQSNARSSNDGSEPSWVQQHTEILRAQLEIAKLFSERNHEDLAAILTQVANMGSMGGGGPAMGPPAPGKPSVGSRFKNWFSPQSDEEGWKGYWNSSVKSNFKHIGGNAKRMLRSATNAAGIGLSALTKGIATTGGFAGGILSKSRLVGARHVEDFKDGLPRWGDLYINGEKKARLTSHMFKEGKLFDAKGKVIKTLAELAEASGDIFDETGAVVLSQADKMRSYVKVNGEIFARVWIERVKRGAKRAKDIGLFAGVKALQGGRAGFNIVSQLAKTASAFGRELLMPPKDVYVTGEDEPRLTAHLMRAGRYTNKSDGSAITRPTQIKGAVIDSDGNMPITLADFKKGLVDVEGKPIRTISQKLALGIRNNSARAAKLFKKAAKAVVGGVSTAGRIAGTFFTGGIKGLRAGDWKRSRTEGTGSHGESGESVSVLLQIRDILDERLPSGEGGGRSWLGGSKTETPTGADVENNNAPEGGPLPTPGEGKSHGTLGKAVGAVGGLIGAGVKGLGGLFRKGKRSWLGGLGTGESKGEDGESEADHKPKEEPKQEGKLSKFFNRTAKKIKPAPAVVAGKRSAGDKDGDGDRDNGADDLRSNYKNINEPTKGLDDVKMPEKKERKNTFDSIVGAIIAGFKGVGSLLTGAFQMFMGKGMIGKGIGAVARAGKWGLKGAAKGAGVAARFLGKGMAGTAGRIAATKGLGKIAGTVAKFGVKRIAMGTLGGVGAVLGSPILGTALAIGGAIWTAKEIYDYFKDDKAPVGGTDKRVLQILRLAEYGASLKDAGAHNKLLKIEAFVQDAVSIQGGKAEIDDKNIDGTKLLQIAGIREDDKEAVQRFITWFNNRFTPVYLKWMTIAKAAGRTLVGLEDMSDEERTKVVNAAAANDGWSETTNPFGSEALTIGAKEIEFLRKSTLDLFKTKGAASKGGAGVKESIAPKDALKETLKSVDRQVSGGGNKEQINFRDNIAPAIEKGMASSKMAGYTSDGAKRVPSGVLNPLQSIRLRMYGFTEASLPNVHAVRNIEEVISTMVTVDDQGRCSFSGDLTEVWKETCKYFGLSSSDAQAETRWRLWFNSRFLPVYTTFRGQLQFQAGLKSEDNIERQLDAAKLYAIAQGIAGAPGVWETDVMPLERQAANMDPKSIADILTGLKTEADKQKVSEASYKPAVQTQEQKRTQGSNATQTPTREYPGTAQMQSVSFSKPAANQGDFKQPNTMPDAESEPKGTGSVAQGIKSPPQMGSLVHAPGELSSGANGMQFIKAPSAHAIEGLNPEVKRLFLAMAEEYGEQTSQSIQVNRGFATRDEQAAQYNKDPRKAAPPGSSLHEFGLAIDINSVDANRLEKLGLMRKYGFTRPVGGETWHIEPAGIQHDVRGLRNDPSAATQAVAASVGRGGGGVGATKTGFRLGGRDTELALKTRDGNSQELKASAGGFAGSVAAQQSPKGGGIVMASSGQGGAGGAGGGSAAAPQGVGGSLYSSLPAAQNPQDARALVEKSAAAVGVDPKTAMTTVAMESGFRTSVKASTSSATGLYQFTKGTWGDMMKKHGKDYGIPADTSPDDPRANAILGAQYLKTNLSKAQASGMPEDISSAYLMHFMGPAGGRKAGELPDEAIMAQAFPQQASANKSMFYNEDGSPRTKAQFMEHVRNKINKAAQQFGISDQLVTPGGAPSGGAQPFFNQQKPAPRIPRPVASQSAPRFDVPGASGPERMPATSPGMPAGESQLIKAMQDGSAIAQQQLQAQQSILEQVTKLVEIAMLGQENAAASSAPQAPTREEPISRAERAMRQVSAPAYKVRSA